MNSQVRIDRKFLQDLKFLLGQPRTQIEARYVLISGIERALDIPTPIPNAGEGVDRFWYVPGEGFRKLDPKHYTDEPGYVAYGGFDRIVSALQADHLPDATKIVVSVSDAAILQMFEDYGCDGLIEDSDAIGIVRDLIAASQSAKGGE